MSTPSDDESFKVKLEAAKERLLAIEAAREAERVVGIQDQVDHLVSTLFANLYIDEDEARALRDVITRRYGREQERTDGGSMEPGD